MNLQKQLKTIVSRGYAETSEELMPGATSVAVPVRGRGGAVIAALGVVSPKSSAALAGIVPVLQVTASALSRKLISTGWE